MVGIPTAESKRVGKRIREAREAMGFTQEDLGDAMSLTRSSVSLWEKGYANPEPDNLLSLAKLLKVDPDYLTSGRGKPPTKNELPKSTYRRSQFIRMQRLIETGHFDPVITPDAVARLLRSGKYDSVVAALIREGLFDHLIKKRR
jgi:transcriptional regulator with XRE-family HTH domain